MLKKSAVVLVMLIVGVLGPMGAMRIIAIAQKASAPKAQDKVAPLAIQPTPATAANSLISEFLPGHNRP